MLDLNKIENAEARRKWLELYREHEELEDSRPSRSDGPFSWYDSESYGPEVKAAFDWFNQLRDAEFAARNAKAAEMDKDVEDRIAAIDAEMAAIDVPDAEPETDDDGELRICALTGLPIFDGDDVIKDEETGDWILRDVLPWPSAPA